MKKKFNAFTLAEVLIVLVILGVISALTVPNLLGTANEKQIITGFKKGFASLNNAINMAAAENGESPSKNFSSSATGNTVVPIFTKTMKVAKQFDGGFITSDGLAYYFAVNDEKTDKATCGSANGSPTLETACYKVIIDSNGATKGAGQLTSVSVKGQLNDRFGALLFEDGLYLAQSAASDVFADIFYSSVNQGKAQLDGYTYDTSDWTALNTAFTTNASKTLTANEICTRGNGVWCPTEGSSDADNDGECKPQGSSCS